ncbi:hypothetical protein COLO4_35117 [Corchorus olitorius]|uniref:Uncharacterized protein n=1 Tax=Corchorus olitorius TaxID=93759 RepID=A0A1R3GI36_9ROSI|nr:hypothetical protein COLO4_35117 [Corchorus olitorius]
MDILVEKPTLSWWRRASTLLLPYATQAVILAPFLLMAHDRYYFEVQPASKLPTLYGDLLMSMLMLGRFFLLRRNVRWIDFMLQTQVSLAVLFYLVDVPKV